jgi:hypothetical protein
MEKRPPVLWNKNLKGRRQCLKSLKRPAYRPIPLRLKRPLRLRSRGQRITVNLNSL